MKTIGINMNLQAIATARAAAAVLLGLFLAADAFAQTPPAPPSPSAAPAAPAPAAPAEATAPASTPAGGPKAPAPAAEGGSGIDQLAWLAGCWSGEVNKREFLEHWLPLRGGMMIGVSHTVMAGRTLDYEYLRLEQRDSDAYYVTAPPGKPETAYRLAGVTKPDDTHTVFDFTNPTETFPQKISYQRGAEGWLYAEVDGKVNGADRKVIYPMRRVSCESGAFILK
jgi:hypothetical protein